MIFNMSIKFVGKKQIHYDKSMFVKFFFVNDNLESNVLKFQNTNQIYFNKNLIDNFIKSEALSEITFSNPKSYPDLILLKKIKIDKKFTTDFFRSFLAKVIADLKNQNIENLLIEIPEYENLKAKFEDEKSYVTSFIEGLHLGNYSFTLKSKDEKSKRLEVFIKSVELNLTDALLHQIKNVIEGVFFARDLVNQPANILNPKSFVDKVKKVFTSSLISFEIFDEKKLIKMGMGALLAVGGGSNNSPFLMIIHYKPRRKTSKKIALVGKGITYDSGGLSIKPTSGMIDMKSDMAGAAVVVGSILAAQKNNLPVEIFGIIPLAENMVSGKSYKPGDVLKSYSGKTIEIKDTDAEGRLILADALTYANKIKPDLIIDYATLTGACVVALGEIAAGLFVNNQNFADELIEAAKLTNERIWQLPMWTDYDSLLESKIADISNLGPRWGGAITAAKFLEFFVDENIPWAHLDIAGPALKHKENSYTENFETGFGVRLTNKFLERLA